MEDKLCNELKNIITWLDNRLKGNKSYLAGLERKKDLTSKHLQNYWQKIGEDNAYERFKKLLLLRLEKNTQLSIENLPE